MPDVVINVKTKLDEKGIKKLKKSLENVSSKIIPGLTAGLTGVGIAAAAGFGLAAKETFDFADQASIAMDKLQASTGASAEEMEVLGKNARNIFAAGFGDDIEDAALAMGEVRKQTGFAGDELEIATKKALSFAKKMDTDVGQTTDAVATLMKEFGLTSEQAFDFIAKGLQEGLNSSDDFVDSIGEYSNLMSDNGFSAEEFFSIMKTGSEAGVLGTDKIIDSIKEMGIILNEGGGDVGQALADIGLDLVKMSEQVAIGKAAWGDFFPDIIAGLNEIDDPIKRSQLQVQIFGTMAEDLGVSFTEGLGTATTSLEDMAGASESVTNTGASLGEQWEIAMRQLVVSMEPVAQTLMPLLSEGIKSVGEFFIAAQPTIERFAINLSSTVGPAMMLVSDAAVRIGIAFGIAGEESTGLDLALKALDLGLNVIVTGLQAVAIAAQGFAFIIEQLREMSDLASSVGSSASSGFSDFSRSLGAVTGFANGGQFTVGGSGGTDSQFVGFNATPGETVTVQTPQQQSTGITVNVNGLGGAALAEFLQSKISESLQEYQDNHLIPALSGI